MVQDVGLDMLHRLAILKGITNKTERTQMVETAACKTNETQCKIVIVLVYI